MCFRNPVQFLLISLSLFYLQNNLQAQIELSGLSLAEDVVQWHDKQVGLENAGVVVGTYYEWKRASLDTNPFLISDRWANSSLHYRGQTYSGINLLYDVYEDLVYMQHPTKIIYSNHVIKLISNQVDWFDYHGRRFYFINEEVLNYKPSFYEKLFEGQSVTLLAKRMKEQRVERTLSFETADAFVIQVNGRYYPLKSKSAFLRLLPDHKVEIKQYVRERHLIIQGGPESNLVALARFCDPFFTNEPTQTP